MNALIYNDNDLFPFELEYSFIQYPNGLYSVDNPKKDNCYRLKYLAKGPAFDLIAAALEESTYINHITGAPFVRSSILYRTLFPLAIVNVEFPDNDKLDTIDVGMSNLNQINYNLIKMICQKWMKDVL